MNAKQLITICLLAAASIATASAQDTIMLMRGKRLLVSDSKVEITAKGDTVVSYQLPNGKHKSKNAYKVFSISNKDGEQVLYTPETLEDELTVEQMRRFLQGKADFSHGFCWGFFAGGVAATTAGVCVPSIRFGVGSSSAIVPVGLIVPFGYVYVIGNTTKSAEKLKAKNPGMADDEYYLLGAQAAISQQRMISGALGVLTGGVIWGVVAAVND